MAKTLTLVGNILRIEDSVNSIPDFEFPLNSGLVILDKEAAQVRFVFENREVAINVADITTFDTIAKVKTQLLLWKANAVQVGGKMGEPVEVTITRPADTTAYSANDAISSSTSAPAAIIFDLATAGLEAGGSGYLVKARLISNKSDITPRIRVHLYKSAPSQVNDNSAFPLLWANRANRICYIDFPALATAGAGSDAAHSLVADLRLPFKLASGETRLWAIIQTLDAFAPSSGQQLFFSFLIDRN